MVNYQLWLTLPEHTKLETSWKKFAIEKGHMKNVSTKRPFVRNLFLVMKKGFDNINFKDLNHYILHHHFKMESLQSMKDILKHGDLMNKLDLKDAYFYIPLAKESKKLVRFYW